MKDNIPYLNLEEVKKQINLPLSETTKKIESQKKAFPNYMAAILAGAQSAEFATLLRKTEQQIYRDPQANPKGRIATTAGAYFANENVIAGSMTPEAVSFANKNGAAIPGWENRGYKIKLGPGITFLEPSEFYCQLQRDGAKNPELAVNYTAPFGTGKTRKGLIDILNARFDGPNPFQENEVIQTTGATEALELALEAIAQQFPQSELLAVGFSYYTALFAADQKQLDVNRVMPKKIMAGEATQFQPSAAEIAQAITPKTKTLLLTLPNNPTGESYSFDELRKILMLVKEKKLMVLFDAIFEEMSFQPNSQVSMVLNLAVELGILDQFLVADGLSKRRGFAGARLGWLATKNPAMLGILENVVLARRCNPALTYEPIAQFEGAASQFLKRSDFGRLNPNQSRLLATELLTERQMQWSPDEFLRRFQQWNEWRQVSQTYYQQNLEIMQLVLDGFGANAGMAKTDAAFNTFIKLGENISSTDFMAKLMLLTGTYTQVGPCFGISEKVWREQLGLWARVSFANERTDLIEGLTRMVALATAYNTTAFGDAQATPSLQVSYDKQV